MNKKELLNLLYNKKLIVIGRNLPQDIVLELVGAIQEGGVSFFELTFNQALEDPISENKTIINALCHEYESTMYIGTGTVLTVEQVQASYEAGASFVLSPNTDEAVISETKRLGMISIAGAMTPSEVVKAYNYGADIVKIFPADDLGYNYIKNLRGPLPHIPFIASGGVNPETIPQFSTSGIDYFSTGISILKPELIRTKNFDEITRLAREHVDVIETLI